MTAVMDQRPWTRTETGSPSERRQVIVAVLQEHGPLTCNELVEFIPPFEILLEWPCPNPSWHEDAMCVHASQRQRWHPGYSNTYADLRILEREERVARGELRGRSVTWKLWSREDEEADAIASIIQAFR